MLEILIFNNKNTYWGPTKVSKWNMQEGARSIQLGLVNVFVLGIHRILKILKIGVTQGAQIF